MKVSHPSGSRKAIELLVIETDKFTLVMKGKLDYSKHVAQSDDTAMQFHYRSSEAATVKIYDAAVGELVPYDAQKLYPIFFENGLYEVIILPENKEQLAFYHEYAPFREAISRLSRSDILTGYLHFQNEVGFSEFEILEGKQRLLEVRIEVFPTKLDYKKDYTNLLSEVNDEIYNLAYHFIKRTHLRGSAELFKDPSPTEFYRLITKHFEHYEKALLQVEKRPHHLLVTHYEEVRGDRLRKQDSHSRAYLRKNAHKMVDVERGIPVGDRTVMPRKGLLIKKQHTVDTHENRYVKFTMERIVSKLENLKAAVEKANKTKETDADLIAKLDDMITTLRHKLRLPFWRGIGKLDRSVNSLVLQMGTGYREVFQVYVTISKSIVLQGELYKMSVKDIATLYEYWTFLKLGRILQDRCVPGDQDIIQVSNDGLFLNLRQNKTAQRKFFHPTTNEQITLRYQYTTGKKVPTVTQMPDSMLSIAKEGKDYLYQYIFDAKYRLDVENGKAPGPKDDDINTMHRYRDSIVMERNGRYERTAFGAYVLFPWHEEEAYREHSLYKSIQSVNIGGLPFLPNSIDLVTEIIDALLNKTADELQAQGILPIGTKTIDYPQQPEQLPDGTSQLATAADERESHGFKY